MSREFKKDYFGVGAENQLYFPAGEDAGFCVSYNPAPCSTGIYKMIGWNNSAGKSETALVINDPNLRVGGEGKFNIVDVDARAQYLQCSTLEECRAVFQSLRREFGDGQWSGYSDTADQKLDR